MQHGVPHGFALCAAAAVMCAGCEAFRELADPDAIEARLKENPERPAKVGAVRGVGVHHTATAVAIDVGNRPEPACQLSLQASGTYRLRARFSRLRGDEVVMNWSETRTRVLDAEGDAELRSDASWRTEIGATGTRSARWVLTTDGRSFRGTETADGFLYAEAPPDADERAAFQVASLGSFQAVIDSADGWRADGPGTWTAGAARLRCDEWSEGTGFVDRLVAHAKVERAALQISPNKRSADVSWRLSDGSTLRAVVEDEISAEQLPVTAPRPERVVDWKRDRSFGRMRARLQELASQGLVDVASEAPEGSSDGEGEPSRQNQ